MLSYCKCTRKLFRWSFEQLSKYSQVAGVEEITKRRSSQGCVSLARQEVRSQALPSSLSSSLSSSSSWSSSPLSSSSPSSSSPSSSSGLSWGYKSDCKHRVQLCRPGVLSWRDWPGNMIINSLGQICNIIPIQKSQVLTQYKINKQILDLNGLPPGSPYVSSHDNQMPLWQFQYVQILFTLLSIQIKPGLAT